METRKKSKPLMEKKRRARINSSLSELKSLLQDVIQEEGARHNKMEKADVLEMTVRYLRRMHQQRHSGRPTNVNRYRMGFNECISEVRKFLKNSDSLDPELHARVLEHLVNHSFENEANTTSEKRTGKMSPTFDVNNNGGVVSTTLNQIQNSENTSPSLAPKDMALSRLEQRTIMSQNPVPTPQSTSPTQAAQINYPVYNMVQQASGVPQMQTIPSIQSANVINGIQLIPTKLVSGQVAFLLPANQVQTNSVINCAVTNQTQILQTPAQISVSPVIGSNHSQTNTIPGNPIIDVTVLGSQNYMTTNHSSVSATLPPKSVLPVSNGSLLSPANSLIALSNSKPRTEKHHMAENAQVWRPW